MPVYGLYATLKIYVHIQYTTLPTFVIISRVTNYIDLTSLYAHTSPPLFFQRTPELKHIPVVMLSALEDETVGKFEALQEEQAAVCVTNRI